MNSESIELILKQLVKAVELLLKQEARRVHSSRLHSGDPQDAFEEEESAQLAGDLRRLANDLHQAIEPAK